MPASYEGKGSAGPRDCWDLTPYPPRLESVIAVANFDSFGQVYIMERVAQLVITLNF
jgi:hypothetical protein